MGSLSDQLAVIFALPAGQLLIAATLVLAVLAVCLLVLTRELRRDLAYVARLRQVHVARLRHADVARATPLREPRS